MDYSVQLQAGVTASLQVPGSYVLIEDTGAAASIGVELRASSQKLEAVKAAKRGHKFRVASGSFDTVLLTSSVDALVSLVVSNGMVDIDLIDGSNVLATLSGPNDGSVAKPLNVAGLSINDAPAVAINNLAQAACGPAIVLVKAANASCRRARFTNFGPDAVAIGGAGLTWATRSIVLDVGDTWVEDNAGGLAWYGITDAGNTATVGVQEVTQ